MKIEFIDKRDVIEAINSYLLDGVNVEPEENNKEYILGWREALLRIRDEVESL